MTRLIAIRGLRRGHLARRTPLVPVPQLATGDVSGLNPYVPDLRCPAAVLVDLDGTAALMNGRSPYDESLVGQDLPNHPVLTVARAMHAAGHRVVFCSGRTEGCRAATEAWLAEHAGVPYEALHLRRSGDVRPDAVVKLEIFDAHIRGRWNVVVVFDDRNSVVAMWRALGLTVLQVADGDF